ncbi:MAG: DUF2071 domain-containing protein [Bdellovibrionales bacterium]|nr:DUF2071 domain-containing protein [Bdellovibrionales bacterium]
MSRSWSVPDVPWIMKQNWMEAFFLNAPIAASDLSSIIPSGLNLDLYDNQAWVSVIPFKMKNVGFNYWPLGFKEFPEVNIRTYVTANNKPGVLFISLDSPHLFFNKFVRSFVDIPYVDSDITYTNHGTQSLVHVNRKDFQLHLEIESLNDPIENKPGSFQHWISERYCFYNMHKGKLTRWNIDHQPWSLFKANVIRFDFNNESLPVDVINFKINPLYSPGVQTKVWYGEKVDS